MRLILVRHGNTFNPGDKVTWVGSQNDLPLVEEGLRQAERAAAALREIPLAAIYHAPLQRTRQFAEIIAAKKTSPSGAFPNQNQPQLFSDNRVMELDYGEWSGRTDDEVRQEFGESVLTDWMERSIWPASCKWVGSPEQVVNEVREFVSELENSNAPDANLVVVSSNGRLRYFLDLVPGEFEKRLDARTFKVGTGKIGILEKLAESPSSWKVVSWNEDPDTKLLAR